MTASQGFVVTFEGCPVAFGTAGTVGATSSDSNWPGVTIIPDLVPPQVSWTETMEPLAGKLSVGGFTVQINDRVSGGAVSAIPAGKCYVAYLGTRLDVNSTSIAASLTSTGLSITVMDDRQLPASGVVWIDQEAILIDSKAANILTVNASGRGYYGTRAVAHLLDRDIGANPMVWAAYPGFDRSRMILWRVSAAGVATVLWIGYCGHAPHRSEPLLWDFQADHFTKADAIQPAGPSATTCRLRGASCGGIGLGLKHNGHDDTWWSNHGIAQNVYNTVDEAVRENARMFQENVGTGVMTSAHAEANNGRVKCVIVTTGIDPVALTIKVGTKQDSQATTTTADPRTTTASLDDVPDVVVTASLTSSSVIPVDRVDGLPASWAGTGAVTEADGTQSTVSPILLGELGDADWLALLPSSATIDDATIACRGPTVTGHVTIRARRPFARPGSYRSDDGGGYQLFLFDSAVALRLTSRVIAGHWLYALRRGCVDNVDTVRSSIDPRQYDWDDAARVVAVTTEALSRREWMLDGSRTFGDLQSSACLLGGCAPGIRAGRQTIVPLQPPLPTDAPVASIVESDLAAGTKAEWGAFEDGVLNGAHIKSEYVDLTTRDGQSVARFRASKVVEIDISQSLPQNAESENPRALSQTVMRRFIGVWAVPHRFVRVVLGPSWNGRLVHGDIVSLTLRNVPDGAGGYGVTAALGQVFARSVSTKADANVTYSILLYTHQRLAGWAPCVRVATLVTATLGIDTTYLNATATDYAGSNLAGYTGTANDGGTSRFKTGNQARLVERDNVSPLTEAVTISSVSAGTPSITLSGAPAGGWAAILAAGGIVDLIPDVYTAGVSATQKLYAYCGAESPALIDSTDPDRKFAP